MGWLLMDAIQNGALKRPILCVQIWQWFEDLDTQIVRLSLMNPILSMVTILLLIEIKNILVFSLISFAIDPLCSIYFLLKHAYTLKSPEAPPPFSVLYSQSSLKIQLSRLAFLGFHPHRNIVGLSLNCDSWLTTALESFFNFSGSDSNFIPPPPTHTVSHHPSAMLQLLFNVFLESGTCGLDWCPQTLQQPAYPELSPKLIRLKCISDISTIKYKFPPFHKFKLYWSIHFKNGTCKVFNLQK